MKRREKYALLGAPIGITAVGAEVASAAGAGGIASTSVCMSALTLVALVLTPTATLGETLAYQVDKFNGDNK